MSEHECDGPDCCVLSVSAGYELIGQFIDSKITTYKEFKMRWSEKAGKVCLKQATLQLERYPGELEKLRAYRRNARRAIKDLQKAYDLQCKIAENAQLRARLAKEKSWAATIESQLKKEGA